MTKDLAYYRANAVEDYLKVPISVLRYISLLEQVADTAQAAFEYGVEIGADHVRRSLLNYQVNSKAFHEDFENFINETIL